MNVLTLAPGITAARFLVRAGWSRNHINSVLRGDNFISQSAFKDIQEEVDQLATLQAKFAVPNALDFSKLPISWKASSADIEEATPESAALVLRKGGWQSDDIQSVLKTGDKHSGEINWQYIDDEASKSGRKRDKPSGSEEKGSLFGGVIFVAICLILFFAVTGG